MNDLIRRKDAIDALGEEPLVWDEWTDEYNKGMRTLWAVAKRDIESLPSIDAVPQWIPCNEMLPDGRLNKSYLVQDKDGRLAVGTYTNWGWMFGHYMNKPVAWMPLPKPYEAERKES